jgi:hypothetical protein
MKQLFQKMKDSGLFIMIILFLCSVLGVVDAGAMTADVVNPAGGGAVDTSAAVSATETRVNSDELLLDTIDEKVTKIRPHDVVADTIARHVSDVRKSNNQTVRHYAIDVIDLTATLNTAYTYASGTKQAELTTSNNGIFASEQTIFCLGVNGYKEDGTTVDTGNDLMLYVTGKGTSGRPIVTAVNGRGADNQDIPSIPANTVLVRGGRAGSESQISTDPYSGVPTDSEQYLQKFIAQVEMTTIFERADKEVEWTFTDVEEEAIFDLRRTQNISYWKGVKRRIKVKNAHTQKPEDVYYTQGIWAQAGKDFSFNGVAPDARSIVRLMKHSFTGNSSGKRKILIMGSDFLEAIEQVEYTKVVYIGSKHQAYGLEFSTIISKFGTLMGIHDQTLDEIGMSDKAFVLDPDFLRKWTMGWRTQQFDLRKSAQSDADGRMLMEICGLVLKNPKAHSRVSLS